MENPIEETADNLSVFLNNMFRAARKMRSETQMTIGKLIDELGKYPSNKPIESIHSPHSYRGYYEDLAFQKSDKTTTTGNLLNMLHGSCLGVVFEGYKGGDFLMVVDTPIWIADYGCCGDKIVGITDGDVLTFQIETDEF